MNKKSNQEAKIPSKKSEESEEASLSGISQIRELVFGEQMLEYESRFALLEQSMKDSIDALAKSTNSSIATLQSFVRDEITGLNQRIATEEVTQVAASEKLNSAILKVSKSLVESITGVSEQITTVNRELRAEISERSTKLHNEYREGMKQTTLLVEKTKVELETNKLDSSSFASMLSEVATKINDRK